MYNIGEKTFKQDLTGLLAFRSLKQNNQWLKIKHCHTRPKAENADVSNNCKQWQTVCQL